MTRRTVQSGCDSILLMEVVVLGRIVLLRYHDPRSLEQEVCRGINGTNMALNDVKEKANGEISVPRFDEPRICSVKSCNLNS